MLRIAIITLSAILWAAPVLANDNSIAGLKAEPKVAQAEFELLYKSDPVDAGYALVQLAAATCDLPEQSQDLPMLVRRMATGRNRERIAVATRAVVLLGYPEPGDHNGMCEKARTSLKQIEAAATKCRKMLKHNSYFGFASCF